ncbi:unnamed protein product [Rotaria sp. Silwood2]|nr:unnamed protein product [Rotaria sp. Silwood2]
MPFTDYCENVKCKRTKLDIEFSTNAHIIFLASVKPCSIFNGICSNCKCIYGPTTIFDPQSNQRTITISSIQNNNNIYFSGDLVYRKEFLSMFSNNLIHAHTTFQGFTESYLNMLIDVHGHHEPIVSSNTLAKRMEVAWIFFELSRFVFLTSREKSIVLPKSLQPESRYIFIEQNLPFFHHLFNTFWSRHRIFPYIKCKQSSCSAVMLIDGHQKINRIICRYENLTNTNHLELGPVNQGCPYPPHRSKSNEKGKNQNSYYCKHHIKYMNTSINQQKITQSNEYQQAVVIDEEIIRTMDNDDMCNVYRNELKNDKKSRSFGVLVTFLSCGVVIAFTESIRSEGCRRITDHLLTSMKSGAVMPEFLVYDTACALRLHWNNVFNTNYMKRTELTEKLYNLRLVIDRFHQKGHKRQMCKQFMNPNYEQNRDIFKHINTSVCEQFFSFLTKFRTSLRVFNYPTSSLFNMLLFHLKNADTTGININNFGLGQSYFGNDIKLHFISSCISESIDYELANENSIEAEEEEEPQETYQEDYQQDHEGDHEEDQEEDHEEAH